MQNIDFHFLFRSKQKCSTSDDRKKGKVVPAKKSKRDKKKCKQKKRKEPESGSPTEESLLKVMILTHRNTVHQHQRM